MRLNSELPGYTVCTMRNASHPLAGRTFLTILNRRGVPSEIPPNVIDCGRGRASLHRTYGRAAGVKADTASPIDVEDSRTLPCGLHNHCHRQIEWTTIERVGFSTDCRKGQNLLNGCSEGLVNRNNLVHDPSRSEILVRGNFNISRQTRSQPANSHGRKTAGRVSIP